MRALLEIIVHLESFRNIDLFYQGLYNIKTRLYHKQKEEVEVAQPYCHFISHSQESKIQTDKKHKILDHHNLTAASIAEDGSHF